MTTRELKAGSIKRIVWNHSRVAVAAGLAGGRLFAISVGHEGVNGAHSFRALAALARTKPQIVLDALEPLLLEPAEQPAAAIGVEA
jgi:hypothetical protein